MMDRELLLALLFNSRKMMEGLLNYINAVRTPSATVIAEGQNTRLELARINAEIARMTYDQYSHFEWPAPLYRDGVRTGRYWYCHDCPWQEACVLNGCERGLGAGAHA